VLFNLSVLADMMQVPVVQVVNVITVLDARVFAIRTMKMVVMDMEIRHV